MSKSVTTEVLPWLSNFHNVTIIYSLV